MLLAAVVSVVHYAAAVSLLIVAMSAFPPALAGFWVLALPLNMMAPDLVSKAHPVAWWLNSLGYGFLIAWAGVSARWVRRRDDPSWWEFRPGAALIAFALIALVLGELYHPVTGPDDARREAIALARAAAAEDGAETLRKTVGYYERVAADGSMPPYVRSLNARNAEEEAVKVKREESRARSERAEAAYYSRLKIRPGTRYPALTLLAFGAFLELIGSRRRLRSKVGLDQNDMSLG